MRNYLPVMRLPPGDRAAALQAKFGGIPWGLPTYRWPVCRQCGLPMSSLAQIPVRGHLDQAGPLAGREDVSDRVLHVFVCERPTICFFWDPLEGANAAFFSALDALGASGSDAAVPDASVLPEIWIQGWVAHDDPVPDELAPDFLDETRFWNLPDEVAAPHAFEGSLRTKLGGVPYWTGNGPQQVPRPPFRYLAQIDKWLTVPDAAEGGIDLANFCSDGTGYLFVDPSQAALPAMFLINR